MLIWANSPIRVTSDFKSREALADLGKWIHDQYGASSLVVGSESQLALVGFYAEGEAFPFPPQLAGDAAKAGRAVAS